jgi:DNA-binding transcriptional LysR family regulator
MMPMQNVHDRGDPLPADALATFVAAARTGSIGGAAASLHVSQPALSRRLQSLERKLGVPLFDRFSDGVRLSDAGRALLPHAERALAAEADGVRAVAARRDEAIGTVTVGAVGSLVEPYVTGVLRSLLEQHPDIELELTTATSAGICDLVRRGDIAVGVSYARPDEPDLAIHTIARERLVVVCAPDHPLAGGRLRRSALRDHRWLVFPDPEAHPETSGTIARRALERHRVPPERLRPIDSLTAQRALAMAGYGLALLPEGMVAADLAGRQLAVVDAPALAVDTPITVVTRRHGYLGRAADAVVELLGASTTMTTTSELPAVVAE